MTTYKTPGVYVEEISVFPPSVAEVETAIPAFIGYTEKAMKNAANDLILKPTKIYSLKEYEQYYGYPEDDAIDIAAANAPAGGFTVSSFTEPTVKYLMYYGIKMFFDNGGGQCYIISIGTYQATPAITLKDLQDGLGVLALEDEPTLIVIPEAVKLSTTDYQSLVSKVLDQCNTLRDRFAIFDVYNGDIELDATELGNNRGYFGSNYLKYGAAYYPFLKTTMNFYVNEDETNVMATLEPVSATAVATLSDGEVTNFDIRDGGSDYNAATPPTVNIAAPGGTGTAATATATVTGPVTAITVATHGSGYSTAPAVSIAAPGGSGTAATARAVLGSDGTVSRVEVTSGGSGYTAPPTVTIAGPGGTGTAATATATVTGPVTAITVATHGSGYTAPPTVTIAGPGGTGGRTARATAVIAGRVGTVTVRSRGSGYTVAPTVRITGRDGSGSGAVARASLLSDDSGRVDTVRIEGSGGSNYTYPLTVTFSGGTRPANLASFKTSNTALYNFVKSTLKEHFIKLPPSGAVAGVYAATDDNRGVWKAPANVSLANVIEPVVKLDNTKQDALNVDATTGISINALRAFAGKGTLVWGARTLAGNDNEWRYISVRRFFNMVEEAVKKSTYWAVFESNDANTWVKVRGMIESYLIQKWREGALAGATPKEALFVRCGLGTTMNSLDILEGRMNVEIGMAVVRPAEFIILKFSHKMQTS
ncbi:MAG: phage tail sheath C-terminal domain-containing protein [Candidatus Competibacteraceae bacterium]